MNADVFPLPLVHLVTPVGALPTLLPNLDGESLHATTSGADLRLDDTSLTVDEVLARAVEHGDTHVMPP